MNIKETYAYHTPDEMQVEEIQKLRESFSALDDVLQAVCPESRRKSLALTHLETSLMWAVKAVILDKK